MDEALIAALIKRMIVLFPDVIPHLTGKAREIVKTRDPKEPGKRRKLKFEERLTALLVKRMRKQKRKLRQQLEAQYPDRKGIASGGILIEDDDDIDAALYLLFMEAIRDGVILFEDMVNLSVDYSNANTRAAAYAQTYVTEWLRQLDETSAAAVRQAVSSFATVPGMTIGDAIGTIETQFGEARAERIAVTEITRAYAEGNQLAGEDMAEQWPDVRVTKRWFTNNDDLVCPVCGPLEGKEVNLDEDFEGGIPNPPAHPNCRCWTSVGTV